MERPLFVGGERERESDRLLSLPLRWGGERERERDDSSSRRPRFGERESFEADLARLLGGPRERDLEPESDRDE